MYSYENEDELYGIGLIPKLLQIAGYDCNLNPAARRMLNIIAGYSNDKGECFPSVSKIAKALGMSRPAVNKQTKILASHGYLNIKRRYHETSGGYMSNLYKLNFELAYEFQKTPDIFCKGNVPIVVTYLATLLSYMGMKPDEVMTFVTSKSYTKIQVEDIYKTEAQSGKKNQKKRGKKQKVNDATKEGHTVALERLKTVMNPDEITELNARIRPQLKNKILEEQIIIQTGHYNTEYKKKTLTGRNSDTSSN